MNLNRQASRPSPRTMTIGVVVLTTILAAAIATAQVLYGSVVGTVTDAQRSVLPGATVVIVNVDTNFTQASTTDARGSYSFVNVPPGRYDVTITLEGFRQAVRTGVPVTVGQISRVDISLEVGALTETVTVSSAAELLQTDTAEVKTDLKSTEIQNLPLNRFRNYQSLIVLVPGSLPPTFQNAETDTPQRSLAMTVNGQTGTANTTRTDGATNVLPTMAHHTLYVPPAETIETVNITTGSMDAEQGMAAGAAITVTTKSGTNTFKGSAFEFFNNEALNATPYYFGRGEAPEKLPIERQTFGGTLGGPIRRDRLFFFGSYEGYISRLEEFVFFDVPDAALRGGDFSDATNADGTLQRVYDPMTGSLDTGLGRTPFPDNVIPTDRIHPIAKKLIEMYPEPNVEGTGAGGLSDNYRTTQGSRTDRHNVDVKVNWNRTSVHQIWGKVSYMDALVDDLFTFPIGSSDDDGGDTKVYQLTAGQTWTLSPTLLLDSAFGASVLDQFVSSPDFGLGMLGLELGVPGTNDQGAGDRRYAGMPTFSTGFAELGDTPDWSPIYRDETVQAFTTNLTKVLTRHELKAGYMLNHLTRDDWQPSDANPRGAFDFAANATRTFAAGSQTANFYNTYAAFLLGLVGTAGKSLQYENFTAHEWQHALYLRDRWTVTPELTLDLGLRWEYYPIMRRADRQIEMLDLETLDVRIGGVGSNPTNMGLEPRKDLFAPRVGVVYRLDDETVVRSGYGLSYDAQNMSNEFALAESYPMVLYSDYQTPAERATFGWFGTLDEGIPHLETPDVRDGRVALPSTVGARTAVPESTDRGKTHSWNVALERRLPFNLSVDVAYVGNRVRGGLTAININSAQTLGGGGLDRPYLVSHGRQLPIMIFTPYTKVDYNALQVGVTRPLTGGLLLKGHYTFSSTWSRGTSLSGSVYGGGRQYELPTPEAEARNWMRGGGSRPHTLTMAFVYELPWQGAGFRQNLVKALISGWQVNGIFTAFSGTPFTVTADDTTLNTPGNLQTADLVGQATEIGDIGADGAYYDPSAWGQPEGVRFGDTLPNQFRGPGGWNLDLSVFRTFPLGGTHRLEARIEATNVTDTPKFGNPEADITSGDFMHIFELNDAFPERQIRLALRYSF